MHKCVWMFLHSNHNCMKIFSDIAIPPFFYLIYEIELLPVCHIKLKLGIKKEEERKKAFSNTTHICREKLHRVIVIVFLKYAQN